MPRSSFDLPVAISPKTIPKTNASKIPDKAVSTVVSNPSRKVVRYVQTFDHASGAKSDMRKPPISSTSLAIQQEKIAHSPLLNRHLCIYLITLRR